jgi:hypothetical protein
LWNVYVHDLDVIEKAIDAMMAAVDEGRGLKD